MTAPKQATLAEALVAFQKEAPQFARTKTVTVKTDKGPYQYKYAPLDEVMSAVRPVLSKNGLAISQHPTAWNGAPALRTILLHVSGQSLEDVMLLASSGAGPQAQGSALTYARRYAVLAVLGLVADEDDDATAAEAEKPERKYRGGEQFRAPVEQPEPTDAEMRTLEQETLGSAVGRGWDERAIRGAIKESAQKRTRREHYDWLKERRDSKAAPPPQKAPAS